MHPSHVSLTRVPRSALIHTDPIIKWASTRWPTFVELCLYVIDHYVPVYGLDKSVMPLGGAVTRELFLNASALFAARGKNWLTYVEERRELKGRDGQPAASLYVLCTLLFVCTCELHATMKEEVCRHHLNAYSKCGVPPSFRVLSPS